MSGRDFHAPPTGRQPGAKCAECGRPYFVNDGHRSYGSDACKQAAYRRRRKAARLAAALARNIPRATLRTIIRNAPAGGEAIA